jgi:hypothetical protein
MAWRLSGADAVMRVGLVIDFRGIAGSSSLCRRQRRRRRFEVEEVEYDDLRPKSRLFAPIKMTECRRPATMSFAPLPGWRGMTVERQSAARPSGSGAGETPRHVVGFTAVAPRDPALPSRPERRILAREGRPTMSPDWDIGQTGTSK